MGRSEAVGNRGGARVDVPCGDVSGLTGALGGRVARGPSFHAAEELRGAYLRARPQKVVRDFRLEDLLEALEALPGDVDGTPVTTEARTAASRIVRLGVEVGVHPTRVLATSNGISIYFYPGGHARPEATRVHALFACENDGEMAVLLTDRGSDFAQAFDVSMADLDDALGKIRRFLRNGPPG